MLPALRAQGMSQVAENNSHDFLLRLGQHLKDGGIARWAQQLVPWLSASQQRVPLRGLMFSLPENKPTTSPEAQPTLNSISRGTSSCADPAGNLAGDR
jgi:type VI secretion system protein ImpL